MGTRSVGESVGSRISKVLSTLNTGATILAGWLLMLMVLLLMCDVVWRAYGEPLHAMAELSVFAMMVVIALGIAACEEHGEHVRLDVLVNALPGLARRAVVRVARALSVAAAVILLVAVYRDGFAAYRMQQSTEGLVQMPLWPVKLIMIGGVALLVVETLRTLKKPADDGQTPPEQRPLG